MKDKFVVKKGLCITFLRKNCSDELLGDLLPMFLFFIFGIFTTVFCCYSLYNDQCLMFLINICHHILIVSVVISSASFYSSLSSSQIFLVFKYFSSVVEN